MGESKRRKALMGDRYGQPASQMAVIQRHDHAALVDYIREPSEGKLISLAHTWVPNTLACEFWRMVDGEQIVPPDDAVLPKGWPWLMRCIEAHEGAIAFVRGFTQYCDRTGVTGPAQSFTLGCKIMAMAANQWRE